MNIRTIRSTLIGALGVALALASGSSSATTFQLTDIGPSLGVAINASGQVTGFAGTAGNGPVHAFLWDGTRMRDLGTLGGTDSLASAINTAGQVTGRSYLTGNIDAHASPASVRSTERISSSTRKMKPSELGSAATSSICSQRAWVWPRAVLRQTSARFRPPPSSPWTSGSTYPRPSEASPCSRFGRGRFRPRLRRYRNQPRLRCSAWACSVSA